MSETQKVINLEEKLATVIQDVNIIDIRIGVMLITIRKLSFESLEE